MNDIHLDSVVELEAEFDELYQAPVGSRATVLDKKTEDGFELVYVEWHVDEEEPYHGEADGWTFAEHFKVVPRPTPLIARFRDDEEAPEFDIDEDEYIEAVISAIDVAADSDAFFMVAAKRGDDGGPLMPMSLMLYRTREAGVMVEASLISLVAEIFHQSARSVLDPGDEDGR